LVGERPKGQNPKNPFLLKAKNSRFLLGQKPKNPFKRKPNKGLVCFGNLRFTLETNLLVYFGVGVSPHQRCGRKPTPKVWGLCPTTKGFWVSKTKQTFSSQKKGFGFQNKANFVFPLAKAKVKKFAFPFKIETFLFDCLNFEWMTPKFSFLENELANPVFLALNSHCRILLGDDLKLKIQPGI